MNVFKKSSKSKLGVFDIEIHCNEFDFKRYGLTKMPRIYEAIPGNKSYGLSKRRYISYFDIRYNGKKLDFPDKYWKLIFIDEIKNIVTGSSSKNGNIFILPSDMNESLSIKMIWDKDTYYEMILWVVNPSAGVVFMGVEGPP